MEVLSLGSAYGDIADFSCFTGNKNPFSFSLSIC